VIVQQDAEIQHYVLHIILFHHTFYMSTHLIVLDLITQMSTNSATPCYVVLSIALPLHLSEGTRHVITQCMDMRLACG
jgi:hypothetical protein